LFPLWPPPHLCVVALPQWPYAHGVVSASRCRGLEASINGWPRRCFQASRNGAALPHKQGSLPRERSATRSVRARASPCS
jgi:hypothetical protein